MFRGKNKHGRDRAPMTELTGHIDDWMALAVDYIDGRLGPPAKAAVDRHLDECPACAVRMRAQQGAIAFLQAAPLETAPAELEDRVLDEVLFPAAPARTIISRKADEPPRWSSLWWRRIKPWAPAAIGVVAVFVVLISYGVFRSTATDSSDSDATTKAVASVESTKETADSYAGNEENLPAGQSSGPRDVAGGQEPADAATAAGAETTTAPMSTTVAAEITSTTTDVTTTAAGDMSAEIGTMGASATGNAAVTSGPPETTQDRKTMITDLKDATEPVCFLLESAGTVQGAAKTTAADAAANQLTEITGLEPLEMSLSPDGPLFAAYVPRNDATQLVDLLRSIGASLGLSVGLSTQPHALTNELITKLATTGAELPELSATKAPQPAISGWMFTTSTSPAPRDAVGAGDTQSPVQTAAHILVVIWVRN